MIRIRNKRRSAAPRQSRRRAIVVPAPRRKARRVQRVPRALADTGAGAYKRLIVDPCYAPLVASPYEGASAGAVTRSVSTYNFPTLTGGVGGVYFFHPVFGMFSYESSNPSSQGGLIPISTGQQGRAVAGCMQASWVAAEATRQGYISCGVVPGTVVYNFLIAGSGGGGTTTSLAGATSQLTAVTRMPVDKCEVNFFPANGDCEVLPNIFFAAGNQAAVEVALASVNFTCMVLNNVVSGAVLVKTVGVVELFSVAATSGGGASLPWNAAAPTVPSYSWRSVLTSLSNLDPDWFIDSFKKATSLVGGAAASYATMGLPGALGYLTSNMMGSRTRGSQNSRG